MPLHQYRTRKEEGDETKLQEIFAKLGIQDNNDTDNHRKMIALVHEKLFDESDGVKTETLSQGGSELAISKRPLLNLAQCHYRAEDLENPHYVFCNGKRIQVTVCKNKQDRYLSQDNMCVPDDIRKERIKYLEQQRKKYFKGYSGKSSLGHILNPADMLRREREAKEQRIQESIERSKSKGSSLKWNNDDYSGWNKLRGFQPIGLNIFPEKKERS